MKRIRWLLCLAAAQVMHVQPSGVPKLAGPYLGMKPPGPVPEIFAPGIISTKEHEYALETSCSGDEIVFMRKNRIMIAARNHDGTWNMPVTAAFSGTSIDDEPCFSPDGKKIYFMSRRPGNGAKFGSNLWAVEKRNGEWGAPRLVKFHDVITPLHAPSLSSNGSIYDDGITIIPFQNGSYLDQRTIPGLSGMYPFVSPDEGYLLFSRGYSGSQGADLYISFKEKSGNWSKGKPFPKGINSSAHEGNSFVTSDGKYLFFSRGGDIYWVSAEAIIHGK